MILQLHLLCVLYGMKTIKGSQVHGKQKLDKQKQVTKPYDIVMCPL